ncbi:MAG: hypothetical protein EOO68_28125 [Moraxellaceae bacterium]|nr:MAG: hypothetical protein EOO68_28125 [Moraxellaceae bacterium]
MGNAATFVTTATPWTTTTGQFRNSAAFSVGSSAAAATQASATDRAIALRQTGAFGDPSGAFVFQIANTTGKSAFKLAFDLQSLDAALARTVTWIVDYGIGAAPTSFTLRTRTASTSA